MELVRGSSLEDELRAGRRFDWREVTDLAIKLCRALKHAHDSGVIHRDIKPANLLLSEDGEIKLSDFGIARLFGNTRLTSDGGVLGTAEYMAPEQADGRVVTDRCDQYSLGGVMYALLAGRPPFRAGTLLEMLQLQRYAEPEPVRRYAPDTPGRAGSNHPPVAGKGPAAAVCQRLDSGPFVGVDAARAVAAAGGLARRFHRGRPDPDQSAQPAIDPLAPRVGPTTPTPKTAPPRAKRPKRRGATDPIHSNRTSTPKLASSAATPRTDDPRNAGRRSIHQGRRARPPSGPWYQEVWSTLTARGKR